jgi:hypothetical protein
VESIIGNDDVMEASMVNGPLVSVRKPQVWVVSKKQMLKCVAGLLVVTTEHSR